jgi:hypothetical protein
MPLPCQKLILYCKHLHCLSGCSSDCFRTVIPSDFRAVSQTTTEVILEHRANPVSVFHTLIDAASIALATEPLSQLQQAFQAFRTSSHKPKRWHWIQYHLKRILFDRTSNCLCSVVSTTRGCHEFNLIPRKWQRHTKTRIFFGFAKSEVQITAKVFHPKSPRQGLFQLFTPDLGSFSSAAISVLLNKNDWHDAPRPRFHLCFHKKGRQL